MADQVAPLFPTSATQPLLVGREREQVTLRDALSATLAGRGSLALIGGEAGIGKTALAEALLHGAARQGALALVGRCYDLSETPPYGPWTEALARMPRGGVFPTPPDLGEGGVVGQMALFAAVREYLAALAAARPLVILLEDLHWADAASLDLLRVIARDLVALPLLIVGTCRADELTGEHPLSRLLPALVREAAPHRITLQPLDEVAVRQLVRADYALAAGGEEELIAYLQARAAGNPLYLRELLRTLEEERLLRPIAEGRWALEDLAGLRVPPLLRQVIAGRLARLGAAAGHYLAVAAVIGHAIRPDLWAAVAEAPEGELLALIDHATAARVLEATPDGLWVAFHHPLIRQALYEGLPPSLRRAVHQRTGNLLASTPRPDPDAVADHLRRAGDPRAIAWLVRAGWRASAAAASLTAAARFAAAAEMLDSAVGRERERGWLLLLSGRLSAFSDALRARRYLDAAAPLAAAAGDRELGAHIRFVRGQTRCYAGEIRLGLAEMERGVTEIEAALPAERRLQSITQAASVAIAGLLGEGTRATPPPTAPGEAGLPSIQRGAVVNWLGATGRYREALAMGEPFVAALAALGGEHPGGGDAAYLGLGAAYAALGRPDDAWRAYERAQAGFRAHRDAFMVEFVLWSELLFIVLPYQADALAARARLAAEAARAWAPVAGTVIAVPRPALPDLLLALPEGRWGDADRLAQAGLAASTSGRAQGVVVSLGVLARHRGQADAAWTRVRELHPTGPIAEPGDCHFAHGVAAQALAADLALDAGDLATARDWIAAHGRWLVWSGAVLWRAEHELLRARHALASGDPVAARAHAEVALAHATAPRQPLALLAAHRQLGELDTAAGDLPAARAHLGAALALADACAAPYERALALLALGELHWRARDVAAVEQPLAEARATCEELGAAPALARAGRLAAMRALVRPAAGHPDRLTEREAAVLRLVAAGQSNREAAAALAVSKRTVERHLENLYRKIAARNRADATAYALRHNLT